MRRFDSAPGLQRYLMRALNISLILLVLVSSCTIEQQGADTNAEFHMPFSYSNWEVKHMGDGGGNEACIVTSGHNGYSFIVRYTPQGKIVSVQSERFMPKGTWNSITVNGHRYETSERYFSARDALALAEDFSQGGKAYAEWSELRGFNGRVRYSNVYKLDGFKQKFQQCMQ